MHPLSIRSLVPTRACLRACLRVVTALLLLLIPVEAHAQSQGFGLNRYNPAEAGSDWFAADSLDLRGHARPSLLLLGDYSYKPLVFYDEDGDEEQAIVKDQFYLYAGVALNLFERLRLAANLPFVPASSGSSVVVDGETFDGTQSSAVGDLRLGADIRLLGEFQSPFTLALGAQLFLPTGDPAAFTGDDGIRLKPRLMAAGEVGVFAYSAELGFQYRAQDDGFAGTSTGNEAMFAAAAGVRVADGRVLLGPELFGSTVVEGGDAFERRTTPIEIVFGGHYRLPSGLSLGLGIGPGLTRGIGAPKVRGLFSLGWTPAIEPPLPPPQAELDSDDDGIIDRDDACPQVAGPANDDPTQHGCPPPPDRDGDTFLDSDDACPDEPGVASKDPEKHGCPIRDKDGDGIEDDADACPDEPGEANDDPEKNGCPPPSDRDSDGIVDADDACPDQAGPPNSVRERNGCPRVVLEDKQIVILERVEFDTGKATIRPESESLLQAVAEVLQEHPELLRVAVDGHTDNTGGAAFNRDLSKRRGAAVVKWLVDNGVDASRLESRGFGPDKPRDSNDTEEGRQNNRRVEFNIMKKSDKKTDGEP
jgi:OOP family OmpA-OmpF porin